MVKYEIVKNIAEFTYRNRKKIHTGCTVEQSDQTPEILESFDSLQEARQALNKYKSRVDKVDGYVGAFFLVEEIYLQENEYDEESEWINGGGIWNFASELNIDEIE
jgi:hypothetical protein